MSLPRVSGCSTVPAALEAALAGDATSDVAAGVAHGFLGGLGGIARAGDPAGEFSVKHRDVVMMIATGENFFARDIEQAAELAEHGAF